MSEALRVVTFAGSDSSGCAGLQADLRTFQELGVHGLSVVTAITAQTADQVLAVEPVGEESLLAQFRAAEKVGFSSGKSGLLAGAGTIRLLARLWRRHSDRPLVVDPVVGSSSGHLFLDDSARRELQRSLLPRAAIVTPNLPETEWLVGSSISTPREIIEAAREIRSWGVPTVLVKGGHGPSSGPVRDLVLSAEGPRWLSAARLPARNARGTGCVLSASLAAFLAGGLNPLEAIRRARVNVRQGLRSGYRVGNEPGPAARLRGKLRPSG